MSLHISIDPINNVKIAESVLLPGDPLRAKFIAENYLEEPVLHNQVRNMLGYTGRYKGVPVSVQGTGMGSPSIGIYSWELITAFGCQNLIRVGTAGSFQEDIKLFDCVVGLGASTDSNYIHAFDANPGYAATASGELVKKCMNLDDELDMLSLRYGNILTSDCFYETGFEWWKKWAKMNVLAVEMEAAALYMNAAYHKVNALAMVMITDHFVTEERATVEERQLGNENLAKFALELATK